MLRHIMLVVSLLIFHLLAGSAEYQVDKCMKPCGKNLRPVCGSDGRTYANSCVLKNVQCRNPTLTITSSSSCKSGVPAGVLQVGCNDKRSDCASRKRKCKRKKWAEKNCKMTCGLCNKGNSGNCSDRPDHLLCPADCSPQFYTDKSGCRACRCEPGDTRPYCWPDCVSECTDKNKKCQRWADRGECEKNPRYMLPNCPKACRQCAVCSPKCLNGECTGPNDCKCRQGWTGNLCQTPVCSPICLNGKCTGPNDCKCKQGWTGNLCQTQEIFVETSKPGGDGHGSIQTYSFPGDSDYPRVQKLGDEYGGNQLINRTEEAEGREYYSGN